MSKQTKRWFVAYSSGKVRARFATRDEARVWAWNNGVPQSQIKRA